MTIKTTLWVRIALLNLCLVALYGVIMRYKIGFEFPYFNQKYLQEAHSHFAFAGWISHTLFFLVVWLLRSSAAGIREKRYSIWLTVNLVSAYGMLAAFTCQGYGPVSLFFSTVSVLAAYSLSFLVWRDTGKLPAGHPSKNWIRAAVFFGVLSTLGTAVLSHMMATKQYDQTTYLGSIYFYLHFQYNGWFLFACTGLFLHHIRKAGFAPVYNRRAFLCFFLAAVPAYFLSTLWAHLPVWLYAIVAVAAVLQVAGWWFFLGLIRQCRAQLKTLYPRWILLLFLVVALAMTVKLLLQLGSTLPEVSKLAFGFRPIVIAYLHLVLLLIVSVFLLVYLAGTGLLRKNKASVISLILFTAGVILNEAILALQGIAAFSYTIIPLADILLSGAALLMFGSAVVLFISQFIPAKAEDDHLPA